MNSIIGCEKEEKKAENVFILIRVAKGNPGNSRERTIQLVPWKSSLAVDMVRVEGRDGGD